MTLEPRKTPKQERARATCDAILEAAARIIAGQGLAAFNTNAVAERAGVSIGSLYQYFPNKDALMAALIQRQQEAQLGTFQAAAEMVGSEKTLDKVVRSLVRAAMQHHSDDDLLASAIDHEEAPDLALLVAAPAGLLPGPGQHGGIVDAAQDLGLQVRIVDAQEGGGAGIETLAEFGHVRGRQEAGGVHRRILSNMRPT